MMPAVLRAPLALALALLLGAPLLPGAGPAAYAQQQQQEEPRAGEQRVTAFVGGTAIDPASGARIDSATVVVEGERIAAVGPAGEVEVPAGAERVDTRGQFVMPGLIDAHVHFFQSGGLYTRPDVVDLRGRRSYAEERALIEASLLETFRRYLASGITSVVDVGGPMWNLRVCAQADSAAPAAAPRVVVAGPLLSTWQPPELDVEDAPILEVKSPERARQIVEEQAEAGVDLIKIWYIVRQGETPEEHLPMARATIEAAHAAGLPVAVHATERATARVAVEAGADILVHSVSDEVVGDAFIQLLKDNDVVYTPTLMVSARYDAVLSQQLDLTPAEKRLGDPGVIATLDDLSAMPADSLPRGVERYMESKPSIGPSEVAMQNLEKLHAAGVAIAAGTDAGNIGTLHGPSLFYELELMRRAGLSPMEVLEAATRGGARLVGRSEALGRLEAGALADLVVVRGDPLQDLANASAVEYVMRGGRLIDASALLEAAATSE